MTVKFKNSILNSWKLPCQSKVFDQTRRFIGEPGNPVPLFAKSGIQLYFQDPGIKDLGNVELLSIDDGCGAATNGFPLGGV